jgi:hypothetical protein
MDYLQRLMADLREKLELTRQQAASLKGKADKATDS